MPALPLDHYWLDLIAVFIFWTGWYIYGSAADNYKNAQRPSLLTVMHRLRVKWLTEMQMRALRMPDVMILNIATSNYTFFASTSILIIAGAFTLLIRTSEWEIIINNIPLADPTSIQLTQLKLLVVMTTFVYSFFKFTWSIRQVGYCAILIGGVQNRYHADAEHKPSDEDWREARRHAEIIAPIFSLAGNNFNHGLRAYYFGMALLPWFIGPIWLLGASAIIIFTLWQREFHSKTLHHMLHAEREIHATEPPSSAPAAAPSSAPSDAAATAPPPQN